MNTLKQFLQKVALRQLLVVCLAGVLMLSSVACTSNNTRAAVQSRPGDEAQKVVPGRPSTAGQGMYPHSDTKRDTTAADAKAERVIKLNEERRQKIDNPKDLYDEVDFPVKNLTGEAEDVGATAQRKANQASASAERAAKNAAKNTQQSLKNLKDNTQNAVEQAADAVDRAS